MYKTKCDCGGTYYLSQATAVFMLGQVPVDEVFGTMFSPFDMHDTTDESVQCEKCQAVVQMNELLIIDDVIDVVTQVQYRSQARDTL